MEIDPLVCKKCGSLMTVIAFISDLDVVQKILEHLNIETTVHPAPLPKRLTQRELDELYQEPIYDTDSYQSKAPDTHRYASRPRPPPG